jgi:phosphoribosylanthranilate isomerase
MPVRVKICCMASAREARQAISAGASAVGLVSSMPSGPGVIDEATIARIAAEIPPGVDGFLLTSLQDVAAIIDQQRRCRANVLQLCDRLDRGQRAQLRQALPGIRVVQVVHVAGDDSLEEALEAAAESDALLLDSGRPDLDVKELGGTGRVHNWEVSRAIRVAVAPLPVWLAGGLTHENVADAISAVGPFGVDVCSGVRKHGQLHEPLLRAFLEAVANSRA